MLTGRAGVLCVLGLFLFSHAVVAAGVSPTEQLKTTIDHILLTLKDQTLAQGEKKRAIITTVDQRFDYVAVSQRTLATNWKKATDSQKKQFVTAFSRLMAETYYNKLKTYSGERVEYIDEKIKGKKSVVTTRIVTSSVEIPIQYKMRLRKGQWLVYDVNVEGVSLVRNYRSSYRTIIERHGIDGLITKLNKKIKALTRATE